MAILLIRCTTPLNNERRTYIQISTFYSSIREQWKKEKKKESSLHPQRRIVASRRSSIIKVNDVFAFASLLTKCAKCARVYIGNFLAHIYSQTENSRLGTGYDVIVVRSVGAIELSGNEGKVSCTHAVCGHALPNAQYLLHDYYVKLS